MPRPADRVALIEWLHHATRPRVLLVEDDATTRYAMRRLLDVASFAVLEAALGEDGMRIAVRERPAAIVLDVGLPDTSGLALLERIDAEPRLRGTPVVVCTSRELADGDVARLAARGCRVIAKRAMAGSLVDAVGAALGGAPAIPSEGL
jgi:DNA-binding response OmpR family regulator